MTVRTRFAPSPTGYMHIGGMRSALFNWLFARQNGGQFILRIDDTDQARNVDEALAPILDAFRWLGLDWDEGPEVGGDYGPYFQSQRGEFYQAAADRLLAEGNAYRCFDTPEQVQADKEHLREQNELPEGMRRSLELSDVEIQERLDRGDPWVLRFKVPHGQKIEIEDEIRGHVEWDSSLIFDPNISRSNGSPLYNFATVVDDAQLKITHVIRAEEHLTNTAIQVLLYEALGEAVPTFAHLPFVMAPATNRKMSKRQKDVDKYRKSPAFKVLFDVSTRVLPRTGVDEDVVNPVMVEYYRECGFLPAGLLNSLGRTGWSFDETTEFMSLQFLIENFSLGRVVKGSAAFDPEKLMSYQSHWMMQLSEGERAAACLPFLQKAGLIGDSPKDQDQARLAQVVSALGDRIKVAGDILTYDYFFKADVEFSPKDFKKRVRKNGVPELLTEFREVLTAHEDWTAESLEEALQKFVESKEVGAGLLIHAIRISSTGSPIGPGVYDCLVLVGKDKVLARIDLALEKAKESAE